MTSAKTGMKQAFRRFFAGKERRQSPQKTSAPPVIDIAFDLGTSFEYAAISMLDQLGMSPVNSNEEFSERPRVLEPISVFSGSPAMIKAAHHLAEEEVNSFEETSATDSPSKSSSSSTTIVDRSDATAIAGAEKLDATTVEEYPKLTVASVDVSASFKQQSALAEAQHEIEELREKIAELETDKSKQAKKDKYLALAKKDAQKFRQESKMQKEDIKRMAAVILVNEESLQALTDTLREKDDALVTLTASFRQVQEQFEQLNEQKRHLETSKVKAMTNLTTERATNKSLRQQIEKLEASLKSASSERILEQTQYRFQFGLKQAAMDSLRYNANIFEALIEHVNDLHGKIDNVAKIRAKDLGCSSELRDLCSSIRNHVEENGTMHRMFVELRERDDQIQDLAHEKATLLDGALVTIQQLQTSKLELERTASAMDGKIFGLEMDNKRLRFDSSNLAAAVKHLEQIPREESRFQKLLEVAGIEPVAVMQEILRELQTLRSEKEHVLDVQQQLGLRAESLDALESVERASGQVIEKFRDDYDAALSEILRLHSLLPAEDRRERAILDEHVNRFESFQNTLMTTHESAATKADDRTVRNLLHRRDEGIDKEELLEPDWAPEAKAGWAPEAKAGWAPEAKAGFSFSAGSSDAFPNPFRETCFASPPGLSSSRGEFPPTDAVPFRIFCDEEML